MFRQKRQIVLTPILAPLIAVDKNWPGGAPTELMRNFRRRALAVQLFEPVKAIPAVSRDLAGLRHVPQLFGRLQQADQSLFAALKKLKTRRVTDQLQDRRLAAHHIESNR